MIIGIGIIIICLIVVGIILYQRGYFKHSTESLTIEEPVDNYLNEMKSELDKILLSKDNLNKMKDLFFKVQDLLELYDIPFVCTYGTLLGIVRHKGKFIPWDDDVDIVVEDKYRSKIKNLESEFNKAGLALVEHGAGSYDKLSYITGGHNTGRAWSWPFVDIFYFKVEDNYVIDGYDTDNHHVNDFFPFKQVSLYDKKTWVPNNPEKVLEIDYGKDYDKKCIFDTYSHMDEKLDTTASVDEITFPCQEFNDFINLTT